MFVLFVVFWMAFFFILFVVISDDDQKIIIFCDKRKKNIFSPHIMKLVVLEEKGKNVIIVRVSVLVYPSFKSARATTIGSWYIIYLVPQVQSTVVPVICQHFSTYNFSPNSSPTVVLTKERKDASD